MPTSINSYALSTIYWRPIDFNVVGSDYSLTKQTIYFNNGMEFNTFNALKEGKDLNFNRKTGLFLTNVFNNTGIFVSNETPDVVETLTEIETPLYDVFSRFSISLSTINTGSTVLARTSSIRIDSVNTLKFIFMEDDTKVMVQSPDGLFLTSESMSNFGLTFKTKISPLGSAQLFDYFLGNNEITLFKSGTDYTEVVARYPNNIYGLAPYYSIGRNAPLSAVYRLGFSSVNFKDIEPTSVVDSKLVEYETNPVAVEKYLKINKAYSSEKYYQNYLGIFPYEYPNYSEDRVLYPLQIHGLKNYQTPEYNYSIAPQGIYPENSIRRDYTKIFSGTNQTKGYSNVYLAYEADTSLITFPTDSDVAFHFPPTSEPIPLNSQSSNPSHVYSGLIEDGAIAGQVPYTSDRIYIKHKDYQEDIPGIPQPPNVTQYSNTWLCSWLSGTPGGSKIWMDRFYNAAFYTLDDALSAKVMVYNDRLDMTKTYSYDVVSDMILYPGVLYLYHHAGKETSKAFLTHLDEDPSLERGAKILQISAWNTDTLQDVSNYNNDGTVFFNFDANRFTNGEFLILNGTNHATFPARSILLQPTRLTTSLWVYAEDWSNIEGNQIFGNYYNSGFGLINDSALTAPLFTIVNSTDGIAYNINYRFNAVSNTKTTLIRPSMSATGGPRFILRTPDLNYTIFDQSSLTYYRFYPDGRRDETFTTINLTLRAGISAISQVEMDSNYNYYIYDRNARRTARLNPNGTFNSVSTTPAQRERIEIDLNNNLIYTNGNTSVIDNDNNLWYMVGSNLYKNNTIFANIGATQQISIDSNNNIWLAHGQDSVTKINSSGVIEFTIRVSRRSGIPEDPCLSSPAFGRFRYINFVKPPATVGACDNKPISKDLLVLIDTRDNEAYLINDRGNILAKLELRSLAQTQDLPLFYADGDFSGYQYLRKYGFFNKRLGWKLKIAEPTGFNSQILSLNYPVSGLTSGWHHICLTFDATTGFARYYIDSIKVTERIFSPGIYQLYYDFRSPLQLGAASIRNSTLNDVIGVDDGYKFIGRISDLRMYAKSLNDGEVEQLYYSSDLIEGRKDLLWNMQTGTRNYIEEIQHWFQMQLPGSKSKYYNINVHNLNVPQEVKVLIEDAIKNSVHKLAPAHTSLYKINWM
jgi:hypothetical protein